MARQLFPGAYITGDAGFHMAKVSFSRELDPEIEQARIRKLCFKILTDGDWCISVRVAYGLTDIDSGSWSFIVGVKDEDDMVMLKLKLPNCTKLTAWDSKTKFFLVKNT